ncbi:MAG: hypothetical protein QM820_23175 [Minicystis sp.]
MGMTRQLAVVPDRPFATLRKDAWWIEPLFVIFTLGGFGLYATWAALQNAHFAAGPYLSPFYSPCLAESCGDHALVKLAGSWWPVSPAFLILWIPGGFRATCYYYRKAYYRSFFGSPPGCAVRDVRATYKGETRFPFILQNLHRYFFWLSLPIVACLWLDAFKAYSFGGHFGIGVGSLVLTLNAALLSLYSLSCHSCRHLCGGHVNSFSKAPARHGLWRIVTRLNERHMLFAWVSLYGVGLTDAYVRLCAMGVLHDARIL